MRAALVRKADDWPWSSASAHIKGKDDILVNVIPLLRIIRKEWHDFLSESPPNKADIELLRKHERTGRPLGEESFIENLEFLLNRSLKLEKAGRKINK